MDSSSTAAPTAVNATASGCKMRWMELLTSSAPISRMSAATVSPARYSTR